MTAAYGRTYNYDGANRLTAFNGQSYGYGDGGPYHAVDRIGGADRFDYDPNGNMTVRNKGLSSRQTLVWDAQNRLSEVRDNNGDMLEQYWYDVDGSRVKKVNGSTTTYTFFAHYEEEVTNGVTTAISHYSLGGLRVAVKRGSTLYHVHGDHLGNTSVTTAGSVVEGSRAYYAYGAQRSASGTLRTDRTFTGQKADGTGLLYYNARYYDPALGTFISPDSLVPDAEMVIDYNRFLYARGNPLKYSDSSGYIPERPTGTPPGADTWAVDYYWKNRWYRARGYAWGGNHWDRPIQADFLDREILSAVLGEAGIKFDRSWNLDDSSHERTLILLAQGLVAFGQKIGGLVGGGTTAGLAHLKTLFGGGATWHLRGQGEKPCSALGTLGCVVKSRPQSIFFYAHLSRQDPITVQGTAIHESAHAIQLLCAVNSVHCQFLENTAELYRTKVIATSWFGLRKHTRYITRYGQTNWQEYWAESATVWVYGAVYRGVPSNIDDRTYINDVYTWIASLLSP